VDEPASANVLGVVSIGEWSANESKGDVDGALWLETDSWKARRGDVVVMPAESGVPGTFARVSPARPSVTRTPRMTPAVVEALGEAIKRDEDALFLL
jgi:hypothetical protein